MKYLFIIILLYSCSSPQNKITPVKPVLIDSTIAKAKTDSSRPSEKLSTIGDFNGDDQQDTLYQHTISRLTNAEIDSILN